jgi:phosphoribosylglycinamide formyltransferase 2
VIPTRARAQLTMNREGIRRLAAETLKLPTSAYRFAAVSTSCARHRRHGGRGIGYPCVVKPVMSSSGKGQSLVRTKDDVPRRGTTRSAGGRVAQAASSSRASSTSTTRSRC